jgi:hypothetical protein
LWEMEGGGSVVDRKSLKESQRTQRWKRDSFISISEVRLYSIDSLDNDEGRVLPAAYPR